MRKKHLAALPLDLGRSVLSPLVLVLVLAGCPALHQSPPARAQEAATELNVNARFGRMEMAVEYVAPTAREAFMQRRKAWGSSVRLADYELAGLQMMKGDKDAEMLVKVAWYRIDQGDLRTTMLKQKWHDFKGDWKLVDESRVDGDLGLIGEYVPATPTTSPAAGPAGTTTTTGAATPAGRNAQFPTIRLGAVPPEAPATVPRETPLEEAALPASP